MCFMLPFRRSTGQVKRGEPIKQKKVVLTQPALRRFPCSQDGLKLYRETCHQILLAGFSFSIRSL